MGNRMCDRAIASVAASEIMKSSFPQPRSVWLKEILIAQIVLRLRRLNCRAASAALNETP